MFKKIFGKKSKDDQEEVPKLPHSVAQSIFSVVGARAIPPMPAAAQKAFKLSTDPNAEARDFIDIIESDEALSARVVKIANSVYFDRGRPSDSIEDCVLVIGINELRCLLGSTTLSEIFPSRNPAREQLWANDIATGLISRSLAQRLAPGKEDLLFLGGLMHDIGKLLLLQRVPEDYEKVLRDVQSHGKSFCSAEESIFPFDHTEVGLLIGERWAFSEEILTIIRKHHEPWTEHDLAGSPSPAAIVRAADILAHSLGLGHPRGFGSLRNRAEEQLVDVWSVIQVSPEERRSTLDGFRKNFELEYDLYSGQGM